MADEVSAEDAEQARLDAMSEAEDVRLRTQVAGWAAATCFVLLLFAAPMLWGVLRGETARTVMWVMFSLPTLVLAVTIWRWRRVPDGEGGYVTGWRARGVAVRMVVLHYALDRLGPIGAMIRVATEQQQRKYPPEGQ